MKPPTGGPTNGPITPGIVNIAMAETSSDFRVDLSRMARPTGTVIEPPIPWRKRASTKACTLSAMAQSSEPAMKTPIADMKTRLAPNLSAAQPESGMKMPSATR